MTQITKSYLKVHYEFRPAKQVERRMLLDTFQRLQGVGFTIPDYQYTGMGSIYFIDFILFHRYLGIQKMLSVESDKTIPKRVEFNQPYGFIKTEIGDIDEHVPHLSPDRRHILWLDYDGMITEDIVETVVLAATQLSGGSILLVTVDVEHPGGKGPKEWRNHFTKEAGHFLSPSLTETDFALEKLPSSHPEYSKSADSVFQCGLNLVA